MLGQGYDTLLHFMNELPLTGEEREEMTVRIAELRRRLINLGEAV